MPDGSTARRPLGNLDCDSRRRGRLAVAEMQSLWLVGGRPRYIERHPRLCASGCCAASGSLVSVTASPQGGAETLRLRRGRGTDRSGRWPQQAARVIGTDTPAPRAVAWSGDRAVGRTRGDASRCPAPRSRRDASRCDASADASRRTSQRAIVSCRAVLRQARCVERAASRVARIRRQRARALGSSGIGPRRLGAALSSGSGVSSVGLREGGAEGIQASRSPVGAEFILRAIAPSAARPPVPPLAAACRAGRRRGWRADRTRANSRRQRGVDAMSPS